MPFSVPMTLPRIFINSKLESKQKILLDLDISRYMLQVLRLRPNDRLIIFNGSGGEFRVVITAIEQYRALVLIEEFIECNRESALRIHLGQGISRGEKMDFTLQKAVELGVHMITPLFTEYCNVKLKDERLSNRLRHWNGIVTSAVQQSGRCYIPQLFVAQTLQGWFATTTGLCLVLDPNATNKLGDIKEIPSSVVLLVGSEGGLSDQEITLAKHHGFLPVNLGPRILRTETAALAAISVLQSKWGDF